MWDFRKAGTFFPEIILPIKPTYAYLCLSMGCWNIQANLDSDLFWAGDGRFCRNFPPFLYTTAQKHCTWQLRLTLHRLTGWLESLDLRKSYTCAFSGTFVKVVQLCMVQLCSLSITYLIWKSSCKSIASLLALIWICVEYIYVWIYINIYVCVSEYMYVCIYVYFSLSFRAAKSCSWFHARRKCLGRPSICLAPKLSAMAYPSLGRATFVLPTARFFLGVVWPHGSARAR